MVIFSFLSLRYEVLSSHLRSQRERMFNTNVFLNQVCRRNDEISMFNLINSFHSFSVNAALIIIIEKFQFSIDKIKIDV